MMLEGGSFIQIGLTPILAFLHRKAAKREILLCDYDGCGKIFSNRQYLNVSYVRLDKISLIPRCREGALGGLLCKQA